jgi:beta-glucosidase
MFDSHADVTEESNLAPFRNPELPVEARLDDLIARLTLEEKVDCMSTRPQVPRLGIRATAHVEGLHGLAQGGPAGWGKPVPTPTTTFPQAKGLAETWDPELIREIAAVEAKECRYVFHRYERGGIVVRAPNADLGRDPRWGRSEECYGEDAYLCGVMTVAFVRGLHGDHPRYWQTAALLKHFLANSNENGREKSSSDFDERLLREYYSVPFREGIVRGGARAFMAAYNSFNGIPCAVHPILLAIAVREWNEDGIICTDGGAFKMLVTEHAFYPDLPRAAAGCVHAGITQFLDDYKESLQTALKDGLVTEADLDVAIRKDFRVMARLGLLDPPERVPYVAVANEEEPWQSDAHRRLARRATARSVVLLKNEGNALPLDAARLRSVAVLGSRAGEVLLDWYSGTPPYAVSPLDGIRARLGDGVDVRVADAADLDAAVSAARGADVAILCVGNHPTGDAEWAKVTLPSYGKEAVDRESLALEEETLIRAVHAVNANTVVVLIASFPYAINWSQANVPAIVHLTHNSQELGHGLADVLFGDESPAGRLVETWPRSIEQLPPMMDYDIRHGRTYMYFDGEPLYPFGYGLSYSQFSYAHLRTSSDRVDADGIVSVSFDVTNVGSRAADEVAQLYVRHLTSRVARPKKELKGFRRFRLEPGETKTVVLSLAASELAYWNVAQQAFVVETGPVELEIGRSSAQPELAKTLSIVGGEG